MQTTAYAILAFFLFLVQAQADSPIHVQITTVDLPASDAARLKSLLVFDGHTHDDLTALQRAAAALGIAVRPAAGLEVTTLDGVTGSAEAHYWVPASEPGIRLDHDDNKRHTLRFGPDMTAFPWINLDGSLDVRVSYGDGLLDPHLKPGDDAYQWESFGLTGDFRGASGDTRLLDKIDLLDKITHLIYVTATRLSDWEAAFLPHALARSLPGRVRLRFVYLDPVAIPDPPKDNGYTFIERMVSEIRAGKGALYDALANDKAQHIADRVIEGPTFTVRAGAPFLLDLMQPVPPGQAQTLIGLNAVGARLTITPTLLPDGVASLSVKSYTQSFAIPHCYPRPIDFHDEQTYPLRDGVSVELPIYDLPDRRTRRLFVTAIFLPSPKD